MRYRFHTADVFTDRIFAGNPLAVFPDGRGLQTSQMQQVAREFNLSETVFVLPPEKPAGTRRVRIFTPQAELPFAGHPTIGTAHVLAWLGEIPLRGETVEIVLEEGVGDVPVLIRVRDGRPVFTQLTAAKLPEWGPPAPAPEAIARALSVEVSDLLAGRDKPEIVSCGLPFLFVPLKSRDAVARARVNLAEWSRAFSGYPTSEIYLFSYETELPDSHVHARLFAPALGVAEDPATGSAAAALAGYLGARDPRQNESLHWRVEQGLEMGRPSFLEVEADKKGDSIVAVRVGGKTVMVSEGEIEIPDAAK